VDRALGQAAAAGRFAETDLAAILTHQASSGGLDGPPTWAGDGHTLSQGTTSWASFGTDTANVADTDAASSNVAGTGDGAPEATR
jgi:hypothetical protein